MFFHLAFGFNFRIIRKYKMDHVNSNCRLCVNCTNGEIDHCFANGCVPANGVGRSMVSINQQLPAPPIRVCKDDRIIVDLMNMIDGQETSLHWHGIHQKETPWMDGVPMLTQCPICSGNTFRYSFRARQTGTHFYHGHSGLQRMNGVFGALIVREPDDPHADLYDFDLPEHEIVLSDWNNRLAEEMLPGVRNQDVEPESLLFNGFGAHVDPVSGGTPYAPMAVFYCEKGRKYRFRIVDAGGHHCPMEFSVCISFFELL